VRKAERFKVWVTSLAKLSFSPDPLSSPHLEKEHIQFQCDVYCFS
jgi:hypothetical protein